MLLPTSPTQVFKGTQCILDINIYFHFLYHNAKDKYFLYHFNGGSSLIGHVDRTATKDVGCW